MQVVPIEGVWHEYSAACDDARERAAGVLEHPDGEFIGGAPRVGRLRPSEVGFLRCVSSMYIQYHEVGRADTTFLGFALDVYDLDRKHHQREHLVHVADLRTELNHHLNFVKSRDRAIARRCREWQRSVCGTQVPSQEREWAKCLEALLIEGSALMRAYSACIRCIEADESRETMLERWRVERSRQIPPDVFDRVLGEAAIDLGLTSVDVVRVRRRWYGRWLTQLKLIRVPADWDIEVRRLVECALLDETMPLLPITGTDVMHHFGRGPGPAIGELLSMARQIPGVRRLNKAEILKLLEGRISEIDALFGK